MLTEPGVYDGIPDHEYHGGLVKGGSLSSTGIRKLLPPSCPALYRHWADNPPEPKPSFDLGHAAHKLVLGVGPALALVDRDRWDTKDAKAEVAAVRARGGVPLHPADWAAVAAMAAQLRAHPLAGHLFDPDRGGQAEQTYVWADPDTGVMCRARPDWTPATGGRLVLVDYKTSADLPTTESFERTSWKWHYEVQAAHYLAGARALGLGEDDAAFVFVMQHKTPPYPVRVFQLDADAKASAEQGGSDDGE